MDTDRLSEKLATLRYYIAHKREQRRAILDSLQLALKHYLLSPLSKPLALELDMARRAYRLIDDQLSEAQAQVEPLIELYAAAVQKQRRQKQ